MKQCPVCHGTGFVLLPHVRIERCDNCKRFKGDLQAAIHFFYKSPQSRPYWLGEITLRLKNPNPVRKPWSPKRRKK